MQSRFEKSGINKLELFALWNLQPKVNRFLSLQWTKFFQCAQSRSKFQPKLSTKLSIALVLVQPIASLHLEGSIIFRNAFKISVCSENYLNYTKLRTSDFETCRLPLDRSCFESWLSKSKLKIVRSAKHASTESKMLLTQGTMNHPWGW